MTRQILSFFSFQKLFFLNFCFKKKLRKLFRIINIVNFSFLFSFFNKMSYFDHWWWWWQKMCSSFCHQFWNDSPPPPHPPRTMLIVILRVCYLWWCLLVGWLVIILIVEQNGKKKKRFFFTWKKDWKNREIFLSILE